MLEFLKKEKCTGCSACMNICPTNAITMQEDEKGFKYPDIDKEKCINCGLCKKICLIRNYKDISNNDIEAYACYNKNEDERLNSSSGGIFILIAKMIINDNGIVFGASLDDNFNVVHSYTDNIDDLKKFMGSKYVQSNIGDSYKKAKEFLNQGKKVLFTGTPCQISGLYAYLQKDYDNLFTQDIVCHGVPSPKVWNKYKEYREKVDNDKIEKVSFRNKDNGWTLFNLKFIYKNKSYSKNLNEDLFMKAFLQNLILRDSCYNCSFKSKNRESDITLADFWGVLNIHEELNDDKGISLLIVHSKKGQQLFKDLENKIIYKKTNLDEALKYNTAMIKSVPLNKNRELFFKNLDNLEFDKLVKKYTFKPSLVRRILSKLKRILKRILSKRTSN